MGWEARLRPHREGDACDSQASVPLLPRGLWSWMRRGEEGHAGIVAVMVKLREAKGTSQGLALAELRGCRELQPRHAHGLDGQGLVSYSVSRSCRKLVPGLHLRIPSRYRGDWDSGAGGGRGAQCQLSAQSRVCPSRSSPGARGAA